MSRLYLPNTMVKYFFISNRQSGKTTKAIYEFLKDPENTIFICPNGECRKEVVKMTKLPTSKCLNIISASDDNAGRGKRYKRAIYDEYLFLDYETRYKIHCSLLNTGVEEILCFSTAERLYDRSTFDFVAELKRDQRILAFESSIDRVCFNDVLVEMTDVLIRTSEKMKEEIYDLYHNYLTDPDTTIIHNSMFFNKKLYNLENVSYFPDDYKELTELKGQFINDTDIKGFTKI